MSLARQHAHPSKITQSAFFFMENEFFVDLYTSPSNVDCATALSEWLKGRTIATGPIPELPAVRRMDEVSACWRRWTGSCLISELASRRNENSVMLQVTFGCLNLRVGVPYVFVHHGDCEHRLLVTEIRALEPGLVDSVEFTSPVAFPRRVHQVRVFVILEELIGCHVA